MFHLKTERKKRRIVKIPGRLLLVIKFITLPEIVFQDHHRKIKTGYSAYAEKYPVYTLGVSLYEMKLQMMEALNLFFEKKGKTITEKDLKMNLDLPKFFEFYKVNNPGKNTFGPDWNESKPVSTIYQRQ